RADRPPGGSAGCNQRRQERNVADRVGCFIGKWRAGAQAPALFCYPNRRHAMSSLPKTFLTPEQYLEIERKAEYKSEYFQGEMFAMAGASLRHNILIWN